MMKNKFLNFLFFIAFYIPAFAQIEGFHFYANLDSVKASGFYNIVLAPAINAHLKTDYSDVRIINKANKWIPHVFHSPKNETSREAVQFDMKFILQENNKTNTILIIDAAKPLNNINLLIKNTSVQKFCSLSGSNDKQNWFVIKDSILLNAEPANSNTESNLKISFPESNYSNLKLLINNRNKDPFNIIAVSQSAVTAANLFTNFSDSILKNPTLTFFQKDSGRSSYIKINQQKSYHFNQINIKAGGLKFYNRNVDLYIADNLANSFARPGKFIQSFSISNNSDIPFSLPLLNATTIYLIIKNDDNPALQIKEISTAASYRYITAYLEKDNAYQLIMGNAEANLATYDITKEYPSIKDSISLLGLGNVYAFKNNAHLKNDSSNNKWVIWVIIIITLLILLFFTKSMIKEVNNKI